MWQDAEWRTYILVILLCIAVVTLNLRGVYPSLGSALRYAAFQVVSIMTTTGYCTADFDTWPHFSRMLLVVLMFVGGCAGSTGGGMKVVRIIIVLKMAYWRLETTFRPKAVRAVRVGRQVVDDDDGRSVFAEYRRQPAEEQRIDGRSHPHHYGTVEHAGKQLVGVAEKGPSVGARGERIGEEDENLVGRRQDENEHQVAQRETRRFGRLVASFVQGSYHRIRRFATDQ